MWRGVLYSHSAPAFVINSHFMNKSVLLINVSNMISYNHYRCFANYIVKSNYDGIMAWRLSTHNWLFFWGNHHSAIDSLTKDQQGRALLFLYVVKLNKMLSTQSIYRWYQNNVDASYSQAVHQIQIIRITLSADASLSLLNRQKYEWSYDSYCS